MKLLNKKPFRGLNIILNSSHLEGGQVMKNLLTQRLKGHTDDQKQDLLLHVADFLKVSDLLLGSKKNHDLSGIYP